MKTGKLLTDAELLSRTGLKTYSSYSCDSNIPFYFQTDTAFRLLHLIEITPVVWKSILTEQVELLQGSPGNLCLTQSIWNELRSS